MQRTKKIGNNLTIKLNTDKLDRLAQQLLKKSHVEIGVMGDKSAREGKDTNAFIGAVHEYGAPSRGIPRRSFLEMPLTIKLPQQQSGIKRDLTKSLENKDSQNFMRVFLEKLAIRAETIVDDAFKSGGFGIWPPSQKIDKFKEANPESVKSPMTLINTGQLRHSITSRIVEG